MPCIFAPTFEAKSQRLGKQTLAAVKTHCSSCGLIITKSSCTNKLAASSGCKDLSGIIGELNFCGKCSGKNSSNFSSTSTDPACPAGSAAKTSDLRLVRSSLFSANSISYSSSISIHLSKSRVRNPIDTVNGSPFTGR